MVIWGLPLSQVLTSMGVAKDVEYSRALDMDLYWIHRQTEKKDIYFVVNNSEDSQDIDMRFRVHGKVPVLWFPDTGNRRTPACKSSGDFTDVSLSLPQHGSAFVVFDEKKENTTDFPEGGETILTTLTGSWTLDFPARSGAPDSVSVEHLQSWTENKDNGIKYFSGTVTYNKNIRVPSEWFRKDVKLVLDLGRVGDIAQVYVNGDSMGIGWKPPYAFDVTNKLKPGNNKLMIKITNEWTNRLLGDRDPAVQQKILAAGSENIRFFGQQPDLQESGLLGPVTIVAKETLR